MSMRITQRAVAMDSLSGLYTNLSKVDQLQQQLTSGKTINLPSDSPTGTNSVLMLTSQQAAVKQQQRNVSDGQQWMSATDSTLQGMVTAVQRIRTLVVQASNTGSQSADARAANAAEVSQLGQSLLQSANTQVAGRPIFGGVTGNSAAYSSTGAFVGTPVDPANPATQISRRVSNTASVRIDVTGPEAFGDSTSPGGSLFDVVKSIATDMVNNPANLSRDQTNLDAALTRMSNALAGIGARSNRLDAAASDLSTTAINVTANLSDVQDVDMAKTIMQLQQQQVTYQAALSVTSKIIQPTLADYLQ